MTITERAITITADDKTKVYGESDPALTWSIVDGSLIGSDTLTGSLAYVGTNVGTYDIYQDQVFSNPNYNITFIAGGTMTITERAITITADNKTKVYGEPDPTLTWSTTIGSIVTGDSVNGSLTYTGTNVGTYDILQDIPFANSNYSITFIKGTMTITARAITVTADDKTKVYGEPDPVLSWQVTSGSIVTGDTISGSLTYTGTNVGAYDIIDDTPFANSNYNITFVKGTMTITERAITITADNKTKVYGEPDPALTWEITSGSIATGDNINGSLKYTGTNVGTYDILQDTPFVNGNYAITFVKGTMTITERAITITADNKTKVYGEPDPSLTWQVTSGSIVTGDTINGSLKYTGFNVGTYDIQQDIPFSNSNYSITFVKGTMAITERAITITADNKTKVYGEPDPALTWQVTSGSIVTGDTINGYLAYTGTNVGIYDIVEDAPFSNSNYTINFVKGRITITERAITITADSKTKAYGEPDQTLTWSVTSGSITTGDTINGSLKYTGTNIGTYDIVEDVPFSNSNYAITFAKGTMTITKRAITITADDKTKVYGEPDPILTWQVTSGSIVSGDSVNGSLTYTGTNVGTYDILQNTPFANSNYTITFIKGTMIITERTITITADNKTKIYGEPDPALTWQITSGSIVDGDTINGSLTYDGVNVGAYDIVKGISFGNSNYSITFVKGTMIITERVITVTADSKTKIYGEPDPVLTWSIVNGSLVGGDTLTGSLAYTGTNIGTYEIYQDQVLSNPNYNITFVAGGTMTITERAITITADDKTKVYGEPDPTLTWSVTSGSIATGDTINGSLAYTGTNVGTYDIIEDISFENSNYNITFAKGTMMITERAITITADNKTKVYGEPDPALAWQVTSGSIVTGDTINGSLKYTGVNVGSYDIIENTPFLNSNYAITFVKGTMTITERAITITADDKTKIYGEPDPTLSWHVTSGSIITGDNINGSLKYTGTNVGTYDILQDTPFVNSNYAITFSKGTMTIMERAITITADNKTKVYGEPDPTLTWSIIDGSLVGGDTLTGSLTYNGANIGTYEIYQDQVFSNPNYNITFVTGGTMTITERAITITADDKTKVYGEPDPILTWQVTSGSIVTGDTINGSLTHTGTNVGIYDIVEDTLFSNSNYSITFVEGTMAITERAIIIMADNKTKVYGEPDPTLTWQVTSGSIVTGDTINGSLKYIGVNVNTYDIIEDVPFENSN